MQTGILLLLMAIWCTRYPALVALHAKDGKYAVMRSAFESSHIREFVAGLGQVRRQTLWQ